MGSNLVGTGKDHTAYSTDSMMLSAYCYLFSTDNYFNLLQFFLQSTEGDILNKFMSSFELGH